MNLEEQVAVYKSLAQQIEELEEQKKALGASILQAIQKKSLSVGRFFVRYCNRLSIKLPLETARALNAVKIEETVDKEKIKLLYKAGQPIEGVSEIEFVQIVVNNTRW